MQQIGSAFMQSFKTHCYMYYDSLCIETLAVAGTGDYPQF